MGSTFWPEQSDTLPSCNQTRVMLYLLTRPEWCSTFWPDHSGALPSDQTRVTLYLLVTRLEWCSTFWPDQSDALPSDQSDALPSDQTRVMLYLLVTRPEWCSTFLCARVGSCVSSRRCAQMFPKAELLSQSFSKGSNGTLGYRDWDRGDGFKLLFYDTSGCSESHWQQSGLGLKRWNCIKEFSLYAIAILFCPHTLRT